MRMPVLAFCFGLTLSIVLGSVAVSATHIARADEVTDLQNQIADRNSQLKQIEAEIANYQSQLKSVGSQKNTLQKAIAQLELEHKKITADISYTQNKIGATDLEISKLNIEIVTAEEAIATNRAAISNTLREMNAADQEDLMVSLLRDENLAEFWDNIANLEDVRDAMGVRVKQLASTKELLSGKRDDQSDRRDDLISLKNDYTSQQSLLSNNKAEKNQLLTDTKSKEANYQAALKQKQAAKDTIEKELRDFESKLSFILDPSTIPSAGTVVFNWPVAPPIIITQFFGGTEFAKRNAAVYGGRAYHPGVDFGVPRGTKILAPLAGTVRAIGNTDAVPGRYSWGKWTLIDHANGLSTLYAHQDLISVTPGQQVNTGDVIGYSGNTGYTTGPHLHFTVYAKAGVSVRKFSEIKTVTGCGPATTPVAATDAYLDPMLYLPPYK